MNNLERLIRRAINDQIEKVLVQKDRFDINTCSQMIEVREDYGRFLKESGTLRHPFISISWKYFPYEHDECTLFRIMVLTEFARTKGIDL